MSHYHAVVWIDHHEAHVLHFTPDEAERTVVHAHAKHRQVHHRKGSVSGARTGEDQHYFHEIARSLEGAQEILVVGPALAKTEFVKHVEHHDKEIAKRIVGVESADHPSDGELLKYARKYFVATDRMLHQPGTREG